MLKNAKASVPPPQVNGREAIAAGGPARPETELPDAFVIDDEEAICRFVSMSLSALGLRAQSFHTAAQVSDALERGHPAIIFLDIALKGSDAVDVIRLLGDKGYAGVVQLMSGSNPLLLEDVCRIGARHGLDMQTPLEKPFRSEAVRRAVTSLPLESKLVTTFVVGQRIGLGLEEALDKGWLELWYQPKINLRTRRLVGAEGLIRCNHPVHGIVAPDSLLPGASDAAHRRLTEHVVIRALREWDEFAGAGIPLRLSVNTSIGALANLHLPGIIREHRPESEAWPGLILEVTESEVMADVNLVHEIATQLRIYGVTLSIDDFGEGYSSFARLRELPFGELKLDRSFVDGCRDDARNAGICQAVIDLAHHFGVISVAEGLEREADLQAIRDMGCDEGQGYLLARPMPRSQFVEVLRDSVESKKAWFA
jgi:EAL domain-containing protein (putative c-di-GMP-specific phosphodiesterase class I)/CheY-like chemotaxis protein